MDDESNRTGESRLSADRETIRRWADEHAATPVRHQDDPDRYRIVPESERSDTHESVEWDDFFGRLDEGDHVVIYHGTESSDPFEVTPRDEAVTRSSVDREDLKDRLLEGETITTEVTETTVVESVVVEEATIESELVDTEMIDESVVGVELLERECMGCDLVESGAGEHRDWFDDDRYFDAVGRSSAGSAGGTQRGTMDDAESGTVDADAGAIESTEDVPYSAELDVEETWAVTREFTERFTIESRVAGTDVVETDTVEDRDIDIEGLQRTIAESDILDVEASPDTVMTEYEIESEFDEEDRIHTHFTREHVVEDEVADRKRLFADVTGGELMAMETLSTEELVTEDSGTTPTGATAAGEADATEGGAVGSADVEPAGEADRITLSDDEIGKTVVDAAGEELGMVTEVEDSGDVMYVEAHPGITEKIKAALDWGDAEEADYPVEATEIRRITDDEVELKGTEELETGA